MIRFGLLFFSVFILNKSYSQGIFIGKDKSTTITFFSDAPLEKIEGINSTATPVFNNGTGDFQIRISMQSFMFKNDLLKEHFNENYIESDKYPYCIFKGKLEENTIFEDNKETKAIIVGKMELHGVIKDVKIEGTIKKVGNELHFYSVFLMKPADYNIKIPTLVVEKIAEEVKVTFNSTLIPYVKK